MLRIVIQWTYYKENPSIFNLDKARWKKEMVYFYDYDEYIGYIVQNMEYSDLQKLRLNIYNKYHKLVKFTPFSEISNNWEKFEGYKLQSPIIDIDSDSFAQLIPNSSYRKRFYIRDNIKEKYFLNSEFINYVNFNVV